MICVSATQLRDSVTVSVRRVTELWASHVVKLTYSWYVSLKTSQHVKLSTSLVPL